MLYAFAMIRSESTIVCIGYDTRAQTQPIAPFYAFGPCKSVPSQFGSRHSSTIVCIGCDFFKTLTTLDGMSLYALQSAPIHPTR